MVEYQLCKQLNTDIHFTNVLKRILFHFLFFFIINLVQITSYWLQSSSIDEKLITKRMVNMWHQFWRNQKFDHYWNIEVFFYPDKIIATIHTFNIQTLISRGSPRPKSWREYHCTTFIIYYSNLDKITRHYANQNWIKRINV